MPLGVSAQSLAAIDDVAQRVLAVELSVEVYHLCVGKAYLFAVYGQLYRVFLIAHSFELFHLRLIIHEVIKQPRKVTLCRYLSARAVRPLVRKCVKRIILCITA